MRFGLILSVALALSGCEMTTSVPTARPQTVGLQQIPPGSSSASATSFSQIVSRIEPVAEQICRAEAPSANCDFNIVIDSRTDQPPNAYQTVDNAGRPILAFTTTLIADARNSDELAFVMGHEAAHHISGHLGRTRDTAVAGAVLGGLLASLAGADAAAVGNAQDFGATIGARTFSKDFELEADSLGTVIAYRSGFDPERGARFFTRIPDPGNRFLGTHPPNASRIDTVRRTLASLR